MENPNNPIVADINKKENFFEYLFNFEEEHKARLTNMAQYTILSIVPIVILLKIIKNYVPAADETKGSAEILVEVILQLGAIFFGIWFIDRLVRYLPTMSKLKYDLLNEINFIIPKLILIFTIESKLSGKINILFDRVMDLWNGNQNNQAVNGGSNKVRVSQPLAGRHHPSQSDELDNSNGPLNGLQHVDKSVTMINNLPNQQSNNMNNYQQDLGFMDNEPMAANGLLGGAFGTSF